MPFGPAPTISAGTGRRTHEAAALVVVTLLASLVTVWWSWPGIRRWDTTVAYATAPGGFGTLQHADFHLNAWTITWVSHALATNPAALFDGNAFYPAKLSVAYSESMLGYVPLFAPVYWATDNPVLALNVMAALTYPLAVACTYLLARLWVGRAAAALAGFVYAFTAARYLTPPHYQCLGIAGFPLIALATEQWLRRARARSAVLLVAAIVWQAMCSAYFLYAVLIQLLVWVPASLWHHRARLDRRRIVGLAGAGAIAASAVVALMWPYLVLRAQGLVPAYDDDGGALGLLPVLAREQLRRFLLDVGPGPIAVLLALLGLALARDGEQRWAKRAALLLVVTGCVAALGPRLALGSGASLWSPYTLLRDLVPGFATVRAPQRFVVVAQLGIALLAALGADRVLGGVRPRLQAALVTAGVVLALAIAPLPDLPIRPVPAGRHAPRAYAWLREHADGRALIELPSPPDVAGRSRRTFLSTAHWHPVVEGYAANGPKHVGLIRWIARALPGDAALQQIVDLVDVGWVLVHRDEMDEQQRTAWSGALPDGLEEVVSFGPDVLYRVTRAPIDDRRARLVSADVTLDGTPIAPVAPACSGTISFGAWRRPPDAERTLGADVTITNTSHATWPAAGFLPSGLVALEATLRDATGQRMRPPIRVRIERDLVPQEPTRATVWILSPLPPGSYVLGLRLVQPVRGTLDDCVAPVDVPFDVAPATPVVRTAATGDAQALARP